MNKELNTAFEILKSVYFDNAYANIELNKVLKKKDDKINYALITKLVYGVLERDIYLDYVINDYIKTSTRPIIKLILKLGRYVSEEVNSIPDYTLVNELVNISKKYGDRFVGGFVNATLKNLIKANVKLPLQNTDEYLSVKYSYPTWIIKELKKYRSYEFIEELLKTELTTLTHIRVLNNVSEFKQILTENNIKFETTPLDNTLYVDYNSLLKCDSLKNKYVVQGLPSLICSLALGAKANSKVLDTCSAPGGKSAVIAGSDKSIEVIACDLHSHRVLLIESYMKKLGINNVKAMKQDATKYNTDWNEYFDYVICDVPCSGIGIVNKKPDILLNRNIEKLNEIVKIQYDILDNSSKYVKRGGVLLYSTCSIMPQENEEIIDKFLKTHKDFYLTEIDTQGIKVDENKFKYTFYPNVSNTEGFFIGRLKKKWKFY